jgi:transposase
MEQYSTDRIWVGLDVHQRSITAAVLYGDSHDAEVVRMRGDLNAVRKFFRRLSQQGTPRSCYEASGAGYVLQRAIDRDGFHCEVIAPSLIPKKPGDRRKTDKRDAVQLAKLYRSGHLTPIAVPDEEQEAIRQLVRARLAVQQHITRLKHRIVRVLATHGYHFRGTRSNWTKKHREWLTRLRHQLDGPLRMVVVVHLEHLEYLETQQRSMDAEIERYSQMSPWRRGADALRCFRGIKTLTAMTILTEIGDIRRFRSATQLMAYTGLVPSERSSGNVERRGPITAAGNSFLRRVLVESAWHNRHQAGADLILKRRRQGQNPEVVAIAVKAQHRLSRKFWKLSQRKHVNKAVVAVARELTGFVWSALTAVTEEV